MDPILSLSPSTRSPFPVTFIVSPRAPYRPVLKMETVGNFETIVRIF
jgi:hypothetical protein